MLKYLHFKQYFLNYIVSFFYEVSNIVGGTKFEVELYLRFNQRVVNIGRLM